MAYVDAGEALAAELPHHGLVVVVELRECLRSFRMLTSNGVVRSWIHCVQFVLMMVANLREKDEG